MAKKVKTFSYDEAMAEVKTILNELEEGETGIDILVEKVERGAHLLQQCKLKLQDVEHKITDIFSKELKV